MDRAQDAYKKFKLPDDQYLSMAFWHGKFLSPCVFFYIVHLKTLISTLCRRSCGKSIKWISGLEGICGPP
ncbi:hypothetical protein GOP47_0002838 [Adiantum capillus-veneris]|uniref:Uncharacterized protein n=1 Tax=Adiantum capillus-veneris TaxID=13818 RepID=A0A9D4ZRZ2_ADICA|nr:hypothetical protein GOP47_0002838 [Adiantum capillus-veneris]